MQAALATLHESRQHAALPMAPVHQTVPPAPPPQPAEKCGQNTAAAAAPSSNGCAGACLSATSSCKLLTATEPTQARHSTLLAEPHSSAHAPGACMGLTPHAHAGGPSLFPSKPWALLRHHARTHALDCSRICTPPAHLGPCTNPPCTLLLSKQNHKGIVTSNHSGQHVPSMRGLPCTKQLSLSLANPARKALPACRQATS